MLLDLCILVARRWQLDVVLSGENNKIQQKVKELLSDDGLKNLSAEKINLPVDDVGNSLFAVASVQIVRGKVEKLQSLLSQGADINARNWKGQSALTFAIRDVNSNLAKFLLANGADVKPIELYYLLFPVQHLEQALQGLPLMRLDSTSVNDCIDKAIKYAMLQLNLEDCCELVSRVTSRRECIRMMGEAIIASSSNSTMELFVNNLVAKMILSSKLQPNMTRAYFEHNYLLAESVNCFELGHAHPAFTSILFKSIEAITCIMKLPNIGEVERTNLKSRMVISLVELSIDDEQKFSPLSYLFLIINVERNNPRLFNLLTLMLQCSFPLGDQREIISPLTLFLVCWARFAYQENIPRCVTMSHQKAHAYFEEWLPTLFARTSDWHDQQKLIIKTSGNLKLMREHLGLPDALMVAALSLNISAVVELLQHWPHSPAYLVVILAEINASPRVQKTLFNIAQQLLSFELPNGLINQFVSKGVMEDPHINSQLKERVCSLQSLAIYTIRKSCKLGGGGLPTALNALATLLPKNIHSLLLLKPGKNVVDNLIRLANDCKARFAAPFCADFSFIDVYNCVNCYQN